MGLEGGKNSAGEGGGFRVKEPLIEKCEWIERLELIEERIVSVVELHALLA